MKIVLLGGSELIYKLAKHLIKKDFLNKLIIISSLRHSREKDKYGVSLEENIKNLIKDNSTEKIEYYLINNLDNPIYKESVENAKFAISISAPWIYKKRHIEMTKNLFQTHNTNLPQWRGGASISWQILAGIKYSCINLFRVNEGIDTGNIIHREKFFIPEPFNTPEKINDYIENKSFQSLKDFFANFIKNGELPFETPQNEEQSSYFPRLDTSIHGCINWDWNSQQLTRFITAFDNPYPGAFTYLNGIESKVHIKTASSLNDECDYHPFQAGIIFRIDDKGIYVCCNGGAIYIQKVIDSKGENIISELILGDRFYTKKEDLEKSFSTRITFSSTGKKESS